MKGNSWLSYWSISLSIIPIIVFYAALYGYIRIHFTLLVTLLFIILALSVVLGIIGIEKNSGTKLMILAGLGTVIAIMSCILIVSMLLMSQMA
ncbi:hypothetical protein [Halobacillus halophilus]|uniref:hypothetical protein n=1 Tax=Halobacillus halophilus TaxID=1570 RepID=UPI001CD6DF5F|nr:hypothetical protein [Halobacillus halophilus]MCA1010639.1 hypothetical protein [Halobacillus halophilus]